MKTKHDNPIINFISALAIGLIISVVVFVMVFISVFLVKGGDILGWVSFFCFIWTIFTFSALKILKWVNKGKSEATKEMMEKKFSGTSEN